MTPLQRRSLSAIALLMALALCLPAGSLGAPSLQATTPELRLVELGSYDANGAEISAYDASSQRLFVTGDELQVLDLSDPLQPTLVMTMPVEATSVAAHDGIIAAAIPADPETDPGAVHFFDASGAALGVVQVGALPDMVTFTPDGAKVLVANEGEPDGADPMGTVSIIDLSGGVAAATVTHLDFTAYDAKRAELANQGVRLFPDVANVSDDVEPEYIAVSPDGDTAWVTLQEANAVVIIDLTTDTVAGIAALGLKDYSVGLPQLTTYEWQDLPYLGTTAPSAVYTDGQDILLGGFSGLYYEGMTGEGHYKFVTHPDRGPNGSPTVFDGVGKARPFPLPDFQTEIVRFQLDTDTGAISITQRLPLTAKDGQTPITGLPNLQADGQGMAYTDEIPVDLFGDVLNNDPLGADMEGIVVDGDGTFWMVDEYRPAIYHLCGGGVLIERYVPEGTAAANGDPVGTYGAETLPAVYAQRRANRGFEAVAKDGNTLYAFVQSPIDNPDVANDANAKAGRFTRILAFDTVTGQSVAEYLYVLNDTSGSGSSKTDKIGDAVAVADGKMMVIERDDRVDYASNKFVFEIDLTGATDSLNPANLANVPAGRTLDCLSADELAAAGIQPAHKRRVTNLASLGYLGVSKPEGLALVYDASELTLAVLNDNDFQMAGACPGDGTVEIAANPEPVLLGLVEFSGSNGLDASDRDGPEGGKAISIQRHPVFGMYMPDAIASFQAGDGETYYVTANEGDARDEDDRIGDITLDLTAFPDAATLQDDAVLGRQEVSTIDGDLDGDGDYDRLQVYGGRSFSIWDSNGHLVWDSGDAMEQITAAMVPQLFNANDGDPAKWDTRSDAKGPEPEGVTAGVIDGKPLAFVCLERTGGVMVYDVSDARDPQFLTYMHTDEHVSPEGLAFIAAKDSPNGLPLLVVSYEESETVAVYHIASGYWANLPLLWR